MPSSCALIDVNSVSIKLNAPDITKLSVATQLKSPSIPLISASPTLSVNTKKLMFVGS